MSLAPPTEMNVKAAPRGPVLELKLPTRHGFDVTAQIRFTTTPLNVWMLCPRCAGRARVMFAVVGKIGCRRCLRVRYQCNVGMRRTARTEQSPRSKIA